MLDGGKCIVGHAEADDVRHFTSTMTIPGQQPVKIVCCQACSTAITNANPKLVTVGNRSEQLKAAIHSPDVNFSTPTPLIF
jgi:hypothetical protein